MGILKVAAYNNKEGEFYLYIIMFIKRIWVKEEVEGLREKRNILSKKFLKRYE